MCHTVPHLKALTRGIDHEVGTGMAILSHVITLTPILHHIEANKH